MGDVRAGLDGPAGGDGTAAGELHAATASRPASAAAIPAHHRLRVFSGQAYGYYSDTMPSRTVSLTGWGRIAPTRAELAEPATVAGAARLLETAAPAPRRDRPRARAAATTTPRSATAAWSISTARLNRILDLDPATGLASCEAGVSLEQLMVAGLPAGLVRAGIPRHPAGDGRRRDRGRRARQEPPRGGQLRPAPAVGRHRAARRRAAHGDRTVRSRAVLGDGGRHGPDRAHRAGRDPAQAGGHLAGQGGHRAHRRHRRDDGRPGRARQDLRLHGGLVGQPGPGRPAGPFRGHQRRLRRAGRPAARGPGRPVRVPAGRPPRRPARVPARPDQPLHRGAGQRGLVPQGAPLPAGRAADHRRRSSTRSTGSGTGTGSTGPAASGSTSTWCRSARRPRCAARSSWSAGPAPPPS